MITACPRGTYKINIDEDRCLVCPPNSGRNMYGRLAYKAPYGGVPTNKDEVSTNSCPCLDGFARTSSEDISVPCTSKLYFIFYQYYCFYEISIGLLKFPPTFNTS